MKICSKCKIEKDFNDFHKDSSMKDGFSYKCKSCKKEFDNKYLLINKEKRARQCKFWRSNNHDKYFVSRKNYRAKNREKLKESKRKFFQENKHKIYLHRVEKYKTDTQYKLSCRLRNRINSATRKHYKSGSAVKDLGCAIDEFKFYVESLFKPGMTWENWSSDGWHLDHIVPLNSFNLTNREEFLKAVHYTNYQPLWAKDNLIKGSKHNWQKL